MRPTPALLRAVESSVMEFTPSLLRLPDGFLGPEANRRCLAAIDEAIAWPSGPSVDEPRFHPVSRVDPYRVCLGKPGKEAAPGYAKPNENDMLPSILLDGARLRVT